MRTLTRIDVGSAFRIGAVVYALMFAIFGLIGLIFNAILLSGFASFSSAVSREASEFSFFAGASLLSFACFYLVGIAAAGFFGGIGVALTAWVYNLAARWGGGLRIQLDADGSDLLYDIERDLEKRKRGDI